VARQKLRRARSWLTFDVSADDTLLMCRRSKRRPATSDTKPTAPTPSVYTLASFTLAAPLHHADEDDNLFVALRALGHADLNARIDALQQEHDTLGALWQPVQAWLAQIAQGQAPTGSPPDVASFATRYRAHAAQEEASVYPHAAELPAPVLRALADAMVARRSPPQGSEA